MRGKTNIQQGHGRVRGGKAPEYKCFGRTVCNTATGENNLKKSRDLQPLAAKRVVSDGEDFRDSENNTD